MKKSTLITTIAMIVVVVVALSTATYAWFTSGTDTQVSDTITTSAASGWYLYGADLGAPGNGGARTVSYSATSTLALHMLNAGLYSPNAALSASLTQSSGLTYNFTDVPFFSAEQEGFGIVSEANIKTAAAYTHKVGNTENTADNLNAIRIVNNNEQNSACHLTILVNLGQEPKTTAYVAGKKFRTYIVTDRSSNNVFNTAYYYGTDTGSTAGIGNSGNVVPASTGDCVLTYSEDGSNREVKTIANEADPTYGYSTVTTGQKFGDTTLTAGDKYYTIDINLGTVNAYEAINLVFYAWFDGWALDNSAAGADISVVYSINGTATPVAVPNVG